MQETRSLILFSENYTYDVPSFTYHATVSMAGIFFFNSGETTPSFNYMRPYPFLNLPQPNFFSIPTPFNILSSTKGLVLCRDSTYTYHVCNPFVHIDSSYQRIPHPPRSHQHCSTAVLALDLRNCEEPRFSIICAVQQHHGYYTFDTYSSAIGYWFEPHVSVNLKRRIVANSGISNSRGMAFWLTEVPHLVVRYHVENDYDFVDVIDVPTGLLPWTSLQIGRIGDVGIGLIVSGRYNVRLFHLRDDDFRSSDWVELCFLNVGEQVARRPEVLRYKKEVPLWIDGRIVFWEINIRDDSPLIGTRLHEMPSWVKKPDQIGDSVPYVYTCLLPITFPVLIDDDEEGDDDEEDDDDDEMMELE